MPCVSRYVHYHFRIQLILLIVGLAGFLVSSDIQGMPRHMSLVWVALIVQFGLKR